MTDRETLAHEYEARISVLRTIRDRLEQITRDALTIPHVDRIDFRVKDTTSFVTKALTRNEPDFQYTAPLHQIEDQVAGRILVLFRSDLDPARDCLTHVFGEMEFVRKEPSSPSEFGYESDHFIFAIPAHLRPEGWSERFDVPTTFEMQVRTLFQHAWAEPQHDIGYKGNDLTDETRRELAWIASSAWGADFTLERVRRRIAGEK